MQKDIYAAIAESGLATVVMDFGFYPHYGSVVFDSTGDNAQSSWPPLWATGRPPDLDPEDLRLADQFVGAETVRVRLAEVPAPLGRTYMRSPFVFVPLQRPVDAVVRFDSEIVDFGKLLRQVLFLSSGRQFVVCKTHPLDRALDLGVPDQVYGRHAILRESFGRQNEAVCDWLLANAALVVGINSNMLFRAIVHGTPVIATGRGWYSGSGAVHEVDGYAGLHDLSCPIVDTDVRRRYLAMCLSRQLTFEQLADSEALVRVLNRIGVLC